MLNFKKTISAFKKCIKPFNTLNMRGKVSTVKLKKLQLYVTKNSQAGF